MNEASKVVEKTNLVVEYFQDSVPVLLDFGVKVLLSLLIYFIGTKLISFLRKLLKRGLERADMDAGVKSFLDSVVKIVLYLVLIMIIAVRFGLTATSAAAILASAGLAIGLALQGSLSNFAGGVLILMTKPFVIGDYIITQTKEEGTVKDIRIFCTKLVTIDNRVVVIPNGKLSDGIITNLSTMDKRRIDFSIMISYEADLKKAKEILDQLLRSEERRLVDEPIIISVDSLEESGVRLGARVWVPTKDYWDVKWRLIEKIKLTFDQENIEIPYPHLEIKIRGQASLDQNINKTIMENS